MNHLYRTEHPIGFGLGISENGFKPVLLPV